MKLKISKSQWEGIGIKAGWKKEAGVAEMWGKTESAMIPKPIRDMVAQKLRDVPDDQLDGAMDALFARLNMPASEFLKAALKKFIAEIRRKDTGENFLPTEPKQLGQPERRQLNPAKPMPEIQQIEGSANKTIKMSKSQWEQIGEKTGWKTAQVIPSQQPVQGAGLPQTPTGQPVGWEKMSPSMCQKCGGQNVYRKGNHALCLDCKQEYEFGGHTEAIK